MADRKPPDIFHAGITGSMLRWLVERGTCTASEFKTERVSRGGTVNNTHSFDRYFTDKKADRFNSYVPRSGSHKVVVRTDNKQTLTWVGSEGESSFQRATAWVGNLSERAREKATMRTNMRLIMALNAIDELPFNKQGCVALFGDATIDETVRWFIVLQATRTPLGTFSPWDSLADDQLSRFLVVIERMMLEATDDDEIEMLGKWFASARADEDGRSKGRTLSDDDIERREHEEMVRDYLDQRPVIQY